MKNFSQLVEEIRKVRKRIALICPNDEHSYYIVERCLKEELTDFLLIVERSHRAHGEALRSLSPAHVQLFEVDSLEEAARKGVMLVHEGQADVLMKGLINTDILLRAVLNKEYGLLVEGGILSHVAVAEIPSYPKLLFFSDAAVIPRPNLKQFDAMLRYDIDACHRCGIATPRVALIHFTEKEHAKFPHTLDYVALKQRASEGVYGDAIVDGPMDVKSACDISSCHDKHIHSPIEGQADVLIFPNIESSNVFYKTLTLFAGSRIAAVLRGTAVPVVVTSRADSGLSKYHSLALACKIGDS